MKTPDPFFLYQIVGPNGEMKTSSIMYYSDMKPGVVPSAREVRTIILESMASAAGEYDWPSHGENDQGLTFEVFGPFFPGAPAASMTQAEYNAIDEDDLP